MRKAGLLTLAFAVLLAVPAFVLAQVHAGSPPYGTQVGSGTVSVASPSVTFHDGRFVISNPM